MKWRTELRLIYRKFGRQLEDVDLAFADVKKKVSKLEPLRATFGGISEEYWPVRPEAVTGFQDRGIFLMDLDERPTAVIREMPITILCDGYEDAEQRLANLRATCTYKFAVVTIAREYLTEHLAD